MVDMAGESYAQHGPVDAYGRAVDPTLFALAQYGVGMDYVGDLQDTELAGVPPGAEARRDRMRAVRYHQLLKDSGQIELLTLVRDGDGVALSPNPDIINDPNSQ